MDRTGDDARGSCAFASASVRPEDGESSLVSALHCRQNQLRGPMACQRLGLEYSSERTFFTRSCPTSSASSISARLCWPPASPESPDPLFLY